MCLLIFAHQVSLAYPLLVAANRDEFHARPTAAARFWADYPQLLAGKDLEQDGTWMGVTRSGRFAAVTNYRDPSRTAVAPRSRGELPLQYLTGTKSPQLYLEDIATRSEEYAGFNLLVGDRHSLWYFTNGDEQHMQCLPPGVYGLSNARLDTPWAKVERGKAKLLRLLEDGPVSHSVLATVVADRRLTDQPLLSGQGPEDAMDPRLSAQFVVTNAYGTRSSTTLWIAAPGGASWREESFNEQGAVSGVRQENFTLLGV